jgi:hypothetical protein
VIWEILEELHIKFHLTINQEEMKMNLGDYFASFSLPFVDSHGNVCGRCQLDRQAEEVEEEPYLTAEGRRKFHFSG